MGGGVGPGPSGRPEAKPSGTEARLLSATAVRINVCPASQKPRPVRPHLGPGHRAWPAPECSVSPPRSRAAPRRIPRARLTYAGPVAAALPSTPRGAELSLTLISCGNVRQTSSTPGSGTGAGVGTSRISYMRGGGGDAEGGRGATEAGRIAVGSRDQINAKRRGHQPEGEERAGLGLGLGGRKALWEM